MADYIKLHPDAPWKIFQKLFPDATTPSFSKDKIKQVLADKLKAILESDGTKYISANTGFEVNHDQPRIASG